MRTQTRGSTRGEVSFGSWACGVVAAQFLAKVQVRVRVPPGPFLFDGGCLLGQWRDRRAGCDPPSSNLIYGRILSIIIKLPWQGTSYSLSQWPRGFPGPFVFLEGGEIEGAAAGPRSTQAGVASPPPQPGRRGPPGTCPWVPAQTPLF